MSEQGKKGDASKKEAPDKKDKSLNKVAPVQSASKMKDVKGLVNVSDSIYETIAVLAVQEVPGVHALATRFKDLIKDKRARGVNVAQEDNELTLSLEITVLGGFKILEVVNQVRQKVAEAINSMTGQRAVAVNIHVSAIHFEEEKTESRLPEEGEEAEQRVR